ncbi:hypothetical protein RRG08_000408, partial [Elysia crispata]
MTQLIVNVASGGEFNVFFDSESGNMGMGQERAELA